jgi:N-acetylmuramoyl-L-alanine amidase-like protein
MRKITQIIVHCSDNDNSTVESMRRFHMNVRGWLDVGYHRVVYADGSRHLGRDDKRPGAHTSGLNLHTLAVCAVGKLDKHPMTPAQEQGVVDQCVEWCLLHNVPSASVIGHRETGPFVPKLLRTRKSCPGKLVDMDRIRAQVAARLALSGVN